MMHSLSTLLLVALLRGRRVVAALLRGRGLSVTRLSVSAGTVSVSALCREEAKLGLGHTERDGKS